MEDMREAVQLKDGSKPTTVLNDEIMREQKQKEMDHEMELERIRLSELCLTQTEARIDDLALNVNVPSSIGDTECTIQGRGEAMTLVPFTLYNQPESIQRQVHEEYMRQKVRAEEVRAIKVHEDKRSKVGMWGLVRKPSIRTEDEREGKMGKGRANVLTLMRRALPFKKLSWGNQLRAQKNTKKSDTPSGSPDDRKMNIQKSSLQPAVGDAAFIAKDLESLCKSTASLCLSEQSNWQSYQMELQGIANNYGKTSVMEETMLTLDDVKNSTFLSNISLKSFEGYISSNLVEGELACSISLSQRRGMTLGESDLSQETSFSDYVDCSDISGSVFMDCYESMTDLVFDDEQLPKVLVLPPRGGSGRQKRPTRGRARKRGPQEAEQAVPEAARSQESRGTLRSRGSSSRSRASKRGQTQSDSSAIIPRAEGSSEVRKSTRVTTIPLTRQNVEREESDTGEKRKATDPPTEPEPKKVAKGLDIGSLSSIVKHHIDLIKEFFPDTETRPLTDLEQYQASNYAARFNVDEGFLRSTAEALKCKEGLHLLKGDDLQLVKRTLASRLVLHESRSRAQSELNVTSTDLQSVAGSESSIMTLRSDLFPATSDIHGIVYKGKSYSVNVGVYKELKQIINHCNLKSESISLLMSQPAWKEKHQSLHTLLTSLEIRTTLEAKAFLTYCKARAMEVLNEKQSSGSQSQRRSIASSTQRTTAPTIPVTDSPFKLPPPATVTDSPFKLPPPAPSLHQPWLTKTPAANTRSLSRQRGKQPTQDSGSTSYPKPAHFSKLSRTRSTTSSEGRPSLERSSPVHFTCSTPHIPANQNRPVTVTLTEGAMFRDVSNVSHSQETIPLSDVLQEEEDSRLATTHLQQSSRDQTKLSDVTGYITIDETGNCTYPNPYLLISPITPMESQVHGHSATFQAPMTLQREVELVDLTEDIDSGPGETPVITPTTENVACHTTEGNLLEEQGLTTEQVTSQTVKVGQGEADSTSKCSHVSIRSPEVLSPKASSRQTSDTGSCEAQFSMDQSGAAQTSQSDVSKQLSEGGSSMLQEATPDHADKGGDTKQKGMGPQKTASIDRPARVSTPADNKSQEPSSKPKLTKLARETSLSPILEVPEKDPSFTWGIKRSFRKGKISPSTSTSKTSKSGSSSSVKTPSKVSSDISPVHILTTSDVSKQLSSEDRSLSQGGVSQTATDDTTVTQKSVEHGRTSPRVQEQQTTGQVKQMASDVKEPRVEMEVEDLGSDREDDIQYGLKYRTLKSAGKGAISVDSSSKSKSPSGEGKKSTGPPKFSLKDLLKRKVASKPSGKSECDFEKARKEFNEELEAKIKENSKPDIAQTKKDEPVEDMDVQEASVEAAKTEGTATKDDDSKAVRSEEYGAVSQSVRRVLQVKRKLNINEFAQSVPNLKLVADISDDLSREICEHPERFPINDLEKNMLPTENGEVYIYHVPHEKEGTTSADNVVKKLGERDPYRWRSDGTKTFEEDEGQFKLKKSSFQGRKGVGKSIILLPQVRKKIFTLPGDYYVVTFGGNLSLAEVDNRQVWFQDLEMDVEDPVEDKSANASSDDSNTGPFSQPTEPQPFAKASETREATPAYMNNYDRLPQNIVEQLLNPRLSPEVKPANALTDVVTQTDVGLIYVFDVSKLRSDWTKVILKDGLGWWKVNENLAGGKSYAELTYYFYDAQERKKNAGYKKKVYFNTHTRRVVIHYRGNQELRVWQPHGNSRNRNVPFIRTSDHAKQAIWDKGLNVPPVQLLHETQAHKQAGMLGAITTASTMSKVLYERGKIRSNLVPDSHDLNVIRAVQEDNKDLVRQAMVAPNFGMTCMTQESIDHMALIVNNFPREANTPPLMFQYDTTFNTGNNYFSVLSITHPFLVRRGADPQNTQEGAPQVPIAVHIHEKKLVLDHKSFFARIKTLIDGRTRDRFNDIPKVLVCDQEFGEDTWNRMGPVHYCWNHILKNVKRQMEKLRLPENDIRNGMAGVQSMLRSSSLRSYNDKLERFPNEPRTARVFGNEAFMAYFMERVDRKIRDSSGRWVLAASNIENPRDGVTTNPAEGLNRRIKEHKQAIRQLGMTVSYTYQDAVVIARSLLDSFDTICTLALYGQGDFTLRPQYLKMQRPIEQAPAINKKTMMEVLTEIRDRVGGPKFRVPDADYESEEELNPLSQRYRSQRSRSREAGPIFDDEEEPTGIASLAKFYVDKKRVGSIKSDNVRAYFVVESSKVIRTVQLDLQHCSCLEKGFCAHYIAALYEAKVISSFDITAIKKLGLRQPSHAVVPRGHESRSSKRPKKRDHMSEDDPVFHPDRTQADASKLHKTGNTTDFDYGIHRDDHPGKKFPHKATSFKLGATSTPMPKSKGQQSDDDGPVFLDDEERKQETEQQRKIRHAKNLAKLTDAQQLNLVAEHASTIQSRCPTNQFKGNWCVQLNTNERHVMTVDGSDYGFLCTSKNTIVAIKTQGGIEHDDEMLQFAARTIRHRQDKRGEIFVESKIVDISIQDALKIAVRDEQRKKLNSYRPVQKYRLICYCREPTPSNKLKEGTWDCKTCKETFHVRCADPGLQQVEGKSKPECGKCSLPKSFDGFKWASGTAYNTCTIDNELTAITLKAKKENAFMAAIVNYPYHHARIQSGIQDCIRRAVTGRWGAAQDAWNNVRLVQAEIGDEALPLNPADLYGNPHRMFFRPLIESNAGSIEYTLVCPTCLKTTDEVVNEFGVATSDMGIEQAIRMAIFDPPVHFRHLRCKGENCANAKKDIAGMSARDSWFLHVNLEHTPYTAIEALQMPKRLTIGGANFDLAVVTFNTSATHFNALLYHNQTFLSYDGQKQPRISLPVPADYTISLVDKTINGVTYLRTYDKMSSAWDSDYWQ